MRVRCLLGSGQGECGHSGVFFFASFGVSGWEGALKVFFVILRERREDVLGPTTSFDSSGLGLLVGRRRGWQRGRAARGRGFEFGRSVIVKRLVSRKGA